MTALPAPRTRRGAALLIALGTLTALGAVSVTAYTLARSENRAGQAALARVQGLGAAESALAEALGGWQASRTPTGIGEEVELARVALPGNASGVATVRNLGGPVYLLRGEGARRDRDGNAIGFAAIELLVLLDSAGPDSMVKPRKYPRGWRILP